MEIKHYDSIQNFDSQDWNLLTDQGNLFLEYGFLSLLENSGCVGERVGWKPNYLACFDHDKLVGALVVFERMDSYGEFIFDFEWARAAIQSGISYYPKLTIAAPFTPASGNRILVHPDYDFEIVADHLIEYLLEFFERKNFSSIHFLFTREHEYQYLIKKGFLPRLSYQFHWKNKNYQNFEDFLGDVHRKKRQQFRKERREVENQNIEIKILEGNEIQSEHIESLWYFYNYTHQNYGNAPYLNKDFFEGLIDSCQDRLLINLAYKDNECIAGTLNFRKRNSLFGRYWGCKEEINYLHFECCFYQLIDYAIKNKLDLVEAGAQGEQKFLRGYAAYPTYSAHWFKDERLRDGIKHFLDRERVYIEDLIKAYNMKSPLLYLRGKPSP